MSERNKKAKAVFLDRDGVINKVIMRDNRPSSPWNFEEFEILPDIKQALDDFRKLGFLNIVFTNQPDISRGFLSMTELEKMHNFITEKLSIDEIKLCPHDDSDNCFCRKPKPGMILEAASKWGIDLKNSYAIGDNLKDVEAGKAAGCKTILLNGGHAPKNAKADFIITDIKEIFKII